MNELNLLINFSRGLEDEGCFTLGERLQLMTTLVNAMHATKQQEATK